MGADRDISEDMESASKIEVAVAGQTALIRVKGRGTFTVSSDVKGFALAMIAQDVSRIIFDMGDCIGLDSTFMGIMAGLAIRLRQANPKAEMIAVNLSSKTAHLLRTLGLDRLVTPYITGETPGDILDLIARCESFNQLPRSQKDAKTSAEMVLQAHEDLVKANPENFSKFKDVLQYLRDDVDKKGG